MRPHLNDYWCIPPKENAEFVARMEDVLAVYSLPYNPLRPVICMDEKPYQLLDDVRKPFPMKPGSKEKKDSEYDRRGTCSIFMINEPLAGWWHTSATKQRTAEDWAEEVKELVDSRPNVEKKFCLWTISIRTHGHLFTNGLHRKKHGELLNGLKYINAKTWELARYGRNRTECNDQTVFVKAT